MEHCCLLCIIYCRFHGHVWQPCHPSVCQTPQLRLVFLRHASAAAPVSRQWDRAPKYAGQRLSVQVFEEVLARGPDFCPVRSSQSGCLSRQGFRRARARQLVDPAFSQTLLFIHTFVPCAGLASPPADRSMFSPRSQPQSLVPGILPCPPSPPLVLPGA